jgi:hypothetical protein
MQTFQPNLVYACQQTIHAGITDDDEFYQYVTSHFGYQCQTKLIKKIVLNQSAPNRSQLNREAFSQIHQDLSNGTRGDYFIVEKHFLKEPPIFQIIFAFGNGEVSFSGTNDHETSIPSPEVIEKRIIQHEIYECKKFCKKQILISDSRKAIRDFELRPGKLLCNVEIPGEPKPFATVKIIHINPTNGELRIFGTPKRGVGRIMHIPAYNLSLYAQLIPKKDLQGAHSVQKLQSTQLAFIN